MNAHDQVQYMNDRASDAQGQAKHIIDRSRHACGRAKCSNYRAVRLYLKKVVAMAE